MRDRWFLGLLLGLLAAVPAAAQSTQDLRHMSLEDLMNIEVTTVSRTPEPSANTPAAVYVITADDIRRSGARSIPEALRLAPGVQVTRITSDQWAIGIRGFTDRLARSMLVLIDGRAVYSTLFAGTYWEVQDTLLDDIDRIEVIRGPGGTLWGANAVNGIINIITKRATDTQGTYVQAGGGSFQNGFASVRYGGQHGDDLHYRAYGKVFDRGAGYHPDGDEFDDWRTGQGGFRADWSLAGNRSFTLQGDAYDGRYGQREILTDFVAPFAHTLEGDARLSGGNVVGRWEGAVGASGNFRLQTYYDRTNRHELRFNEERDTFDVDFQHTLNVASAHRLTWGAAYRLSSGRTQSVATEFFTPADRTDNLGSVFAQDEIRVVPERLRVSAGVKVEHNDYTGFEVQPSVRGTWTPSEDQTVFAAVTRAVRTPSRVETDLEIESFLTRLPPGPLFLRLSPNPDFQSEKLIAYELGYRIRPAQSLFVTVSGFVNQLQDVLSTDARPLFVEASPAPLHFIIPLQFGNTLHGASEGVETTADYRMTPWWRWEGSYSYLRIALTRDPGSLDVSQETRGEGLSPRHQAQLRASLDLAHGVTFDWMLRAVSRLPAGPVPAYATSDVRLGWRVTPQVELAVVGQDLNQAHHLEFPGGSMGNVEVPRSVYASITWTR
jgi:iron complex outermembrane receptor protein